MHRPYVLKRCSDGVIRPRMALIPKEEFFKFLLSKSKSVEGPLKTPCLVWTGYKSKRGYGSVNFLGRGMRVNRITWILHHGDIPLGLEVCHHCDNPSCFEPSHLFLGTHTDNMRDCIKKGRYGLQPLRGSHNHFSKLTEKEVRKLRELRGQGIKTGVLASRFNISTTHVANIVYRRNWTHI